MKSILFVITAVIIFTSTTYTQFLQRNLILGIGAGISAPMSPSGFSDAFNLGPHVSVSAGYLMNDNIVLRGGLGYNSFPLDESSPNYSAAYKVISLKGEVLAGDFDPSTINLYGLAGLGFYFTSYSVSQGGVEQSVSETEFGIAIGGGVNFRLNPKLGVFVETDYNLIFTEGDNTGYLPIKVGLMIAP